MESLPFGNFNSFEENSFRALPASENTENADSTSPQIPPIKIKKRIFDPEKQSCTLEIKIGEPFNIIVYKSGSVGRIAFQLAEQFALPIAPKDLAERLAPQIDSAQWHKVTESEESLYYSFHSWLLEKGADYFARGQMWYHDKNGKRYIRVTSEPLRAFFVSQGITNRKERETVLSYWREKKWLNAGGERRLNKNIKVTLPNGSKGWIQVYEILVAEDLPFDEEETLTSTPSTPSLENNAEKTENGAVKLLNTVKLLNLNNGQELSLTLVKSNSADRTELGESKITTNSPLGRALLGRKVGETFTVEVDGHLTVYKVLEINPTN